MKKKLILAGVILIMIIAVLGGCVNEIKETKTIDVPLNTLTLTLDELSEDYKEANEQYITEPYIVEEGFFFEGWLVLEKYEMLFTHNESNFIMQTLSKLESKEKCEEFIDNIRNSNLGYDFSELSMETIGEGSYLGKNTTTIFENNVTLYLICFRIEDITVVLLSSSIQKDSLREYASIIEKNINEV